MSPVTITVKKDKSAKIALVSRKLSESTIKKKAQMPNMEELISRVSRKNIRKTRKGDMENEIRFRLCIWSNQIG